MKTNRFTDPSKYRDPAGERRRRRREMILIPIVILVVGLLTVAESRIIHFGADFPISNTILMFILINVNLLLLILLIFLVFRNLVKLLYDRRRKVLGTRLRTRLVLAFVSLSLLPTVVLFIFSINFITSSIEFWFNVPVEQSLENSLQVGRRLYGYFEDHNRFFTERIADEIVSKDLMAPGNRSKLLNYAEVVQRAFNIEAVEIYKAGTAEDDPEHKVPDRQAVATSPEFGDDLQEIDLDQLTKAVNADGVRTVSERIPQGEISRTIGRIPFDAEAGDSRGFVVLSFLIPPSLSDDLETISRGFEEYKQIKLLKEPIQLTYYITISIVALLVVFCAVWFGFYLAKSISIPIMDLAEGTRRVAGGDLGFTLHRVGDDEIGVLVDSFNQMTHDLRLSREQLELSAQMLRQQNVEIEERRRYIEIVLKNVSAGVVTLDRDGHVATINPAAEAMLGIPADEILGQSYRALLQGQHLDLASEVRDYLTVSREDSVAFPLRMTIDGSPRSFRVNISVLKDDAGRDMGMVMVVDDLTELEKAQRMAAWREVARRIAHEVKNPLTPIKLSAQRLHRKYARRLGEPVFEECTRMIIDHVDLIRNLVNEFSAFARFPAADPSPCDLAAIVDETLALFRESHPEITFQTALPPDLPPLHLDRQQMKQALINLVSNAIGAIRDRGEVTVTVHGGNGKKGVRIEVADNGPGISDEDKRRLFEPYFSTKKSGMGLGLTIVSSIVADHNGKISVGDNHPHGAKFIIDLPGENNP